MIHAKELFTMKGRCRAISWNVVTHEIVDIQERENTLFTAWKTALVKDTALETHIAKPRILAFSKDFVAETGPPTELTNEFRSSIALVRASNTLQLVATIPSTVGNSPAGNIVSVGFYYGTDATTTLETGILGSLINTFNVEKTSEIEVTFQYDIVYG